MTRLHRLAETYDNSPSQSVVESYVTDDGQVIVNIEVELYSGTYSLRGLLKHASSGYRPAEHDEVGELATIEAARAQIERVADTVVGRWSGVVRRQPRRASGAPSKNLNIRVPADVLDAAKAKAKGDGVTLSAAVVDLLRGYVAEE